MSYICPTTQLEYPHFMINNFQLQGTAASSESMHFKKNGEVSGNLNVLKFKDKDTDQFVYYCPSLEISGYGTTKEKAMELLKDSVDQFFIYLSQLPAKKRMDELSSLGWRQNKFRNKDFSNLYVDVEGKLKGFNVSMGDVETQKLELGTAA